MLFSSLEFAVFFLVVLTVHLVLGHGRGLRRIGIDARRAAFLQKVLLLAASYVFYASWSPKLLMLIVASSAIDYLVGRGLERSETQRVRRALLVTSLVCNLGLLGFFKYWNFFVGEAVAALNAVGFHAAYAPLSIILPVGISFYTFQTLSYSIDVYRGSLRPTRSALDFFLFVGFFPQLVAGPIVRASEFLPQLGSQPKRPARSDLLSGLDLFLVGLFKKVVIADVIAVVVDQTFLDWTRYSSLEVLAGIIGFTIQIYADFSGYTDMARGTARMLGFELPVNFRLPYLACCITDFWRRWHISLSTWFRDYLYIPLGGNRGGRLRTYRNLITTFLLTGLWHGASWNFVAFGAWNGTLLILERRNRRTNRLPLPLAGLGFLWASVATWFSFLIFRATSLGQVSAMTTAVFSGQGGGAPFPWARFVFAGTLLCAYHLEAAHGVFQKLMATRYALFLRSFWYTVTLGLSFAAMQTGGTEPRAFIYFQF